MGSTDALRKLRQMRVTMVITSDDLQKLELKKIGLLWGEEESHVSRRGKMNLGQVTRTPMVIETDEKCTELEVGRG